MNFHKSIESNAENGKTVENLKKFSSGTQSDPEAQHAPHQANFFYKKTLSLRYQTIYFKPF